ncbi:MAG: biopolymer transporter ExbD, partial [Pseudorhodoplanes sp.]
YRELMNVMNLLRQAGYLKVALVGLEDTGQSAIPTPTPVSSPRPP